MFKVDDAIRELSTTQGAGDYILAGAVASYRPFSTFADGVYTSLFVTDGVNREWGIYRFRTGPNRLERTHIHGSTNGGAAVSWGVGNKTLRCAPLASMEKPRVKTKDVNGTGVIVLTQDEQRCDVLVLTGALTGARQVEVDDTPWAWRALVNNTSGLFPLTVRATGQTGVEFYQGRATPAVHDGTDVKKAADDPAPGEYEDYSQTAVNDGRVLTCEGQNVSRATFPALTQKIMKSATVTFTNGTDRVNWAAHGLQEGDVFKFYTTGAAPTGLTASTPGGATTTYFVINPTANDFQIAATEGGAAINFTSDGTGTHTGVHAPHGDGDGSTTVTLPDFRRRVPVGARGTGTAQLRKAVGATGGAESRTIGTTNLPASGLSVPGLSIPGLSIPALSVQGTPTPGDGSNVHRAPKIERNQTSMSLETTTQGGANASTTGTGTTGTGTTGNMGSGTAFDEMQPGLVVTKTIRI